jgi:hypothetical protein
MRNKCNKNKVNKKFIIFFFLDLLHNDDVYLNKIKLQHWGYKNYLSHVKYGRAKKDISTRKEQDNMTNTKQDYSPSLGL